ncbi:excinuclease ABC subunit UvrC [Kitasatospora aburaviensis]
MADPSTYRPAPGAIPTSPGVYKFRDAHGRVIYVGKAKSLRPRLSSYFQDLAGLHPRTATMVTTAASVEWTVVATEVEALQLEYSWIKEFDPRFNVKYRDDKSYPELAVTLNEEYPRVQVMRGAHKKGVRYFGPYGHAWAIRETVDLLLRVFPVRTCSNGVFKRARQVGRPCLLGYIGKCAAPCVGKVSADEHRALAEDFCDFMAGRTGNYLRRLEEQMQEAAAEMEYEKAARLRDDIGALKRAMEKNAIVLADATDADLLAVAEDELEAAVQIFHVRGGRVRGQRGWVTDKVEDVDTAGLVEHALQQLYGGAGAEERSESVPREVLVPALPEPAEPVREWLSGLRGSQVDLRVPQRGDKKDLMATVQRNAQQALALHKTKRASDLTTRSRALQEIADALELDSVPLRIECFDISHLQGEDVVASMVVFEDGLARKSEYRRFQIKGFEGQDDVRSMHEVISRRFRRYLQEREQTGSGPSPRPTTRSARTTGPTRTAPGPRRSPGRRLPSAHRWPRGHRRRRGPGRPDRPRHRPPAPLRLPAAAAGRRRRAAAGRRRQARPGRAGHRRRRPLRPGQAPGGGLAARRGRPGGPAAQQRGPLPAPAGPRRGPPVRDHLPAQQAFQATHRRGTGLRPRPRRDSPPGTAQALRLAEEAPGGHCRRTLRRPRHRTPDGGDCCGSVVVPYTRGTRSEHRHRRDHR